MTIGVALLLIAVGAVLRFAVTAHVSGVNIAAVGDILMAVGAVGFIIAVIWLTSARHRRISVIEQPTYAPPTVTTPAPYPTAAPAPERRYEDPPLR